MPERQGRVVLFDIVRVFSASLVVLVHILQKYGSPFGLWFGIKGFYFVSIGGLGVTFLLVLSGMGLESGYREKPYAYGAYIGKRFRRIYPLYWLSLLITSALFGFSRLPQAGWPNWFLELSGAMAFTGRSWTTFVLPPAWFIGVIVSMYFVYPIISALMRRHAGASLLSLLILSAVSRYFAGMFEIRAEDWFPLCRLFEFGLGVWIVNNQELYKFVCGVGANLSRSVKTVLKFCGDLSFPVYLIHWPVLHMPLANNFPMWVSIPLVLCSTFILAAVMLRIDRARIPIKFKEARVQEV